jgi:Tfp pilus assembly protein PilN
MRAVNLLPVEARGGRRRPPTPALAIAAAGVLLASVLAVAFFSANGTVDEREQELAAVEEQVEVLRTETEKEKAKRAQPALTAERDQRLAALNAALAERLAWDRVLGDISLVIPDDVWLSKLTAGGAGEAADGTEAATPTTGITLTFTGFTYSQESVARLLTRLGLAPELQNVRLQQSSVTEVGERELFGFTVLADVNGPGGTP